MDFDKLFLVYLDQNMLGTPLEALIANPKKYDYWKNNLHIAFSDETIKEIIRSGALADKFLSNLSKFNTVYLRLELDDSWHLTGRIVGKHLCPKERYEDLKQNMLPIDEAVLLHKFYGGQPDKSLSDLMKQQTKDSIENIKKSIIELQQACSAEGIEVDLSNLNINHLEQNSKELLDLQTKQIEGSVPEDQQSNMRKLWREAMEIDINVVSSFKGPNIVEAILDYVRLRPPFQQAGLTTNETFFLEGIHPIRKNEMGIFDQAHAVLNMLQFVGFHQDKKVHKDQKFKATFSDMMHGGIAVASNIFVTGDMNLRKRLAATYEYLGFGPLVCYLDYENTLDFVEEPKIIQ